MPLLLSVGLCIDYCTHISHTFSEATGTSPERAIAALRIRGAAVLNGGLSTALSVGLLAFGNSAIFTTFFWLLLGVVAVGLSHALLVLPACLSLLPTAHVSSQLTSSTTARPTGGATEMRATSQACVV